ncbi:MAG: hypothetical protein IPL46_22745 [Saprospiraceae bacterium]|nr:hypothetical protein [Saprospiraceae bacterium]
MTLLRFLIYLPVFTISTNTSFAQWSRADETTRLTNGADKIWVDEIAPISGGTHRLYLNGDPGVYGNLLVNLNADNMSSSESLLRLSTNSPSSTSAKLLYGTHGSGNPVFDFLASGRLNLLDPMGSFNRALEVRGDEAIWYDSDYFSWGFDGNWNRFARPVTLGGATQPPFRYCVAHNRQL